MKKAFNRHAMISASIEVTIIASWGRGAAEFVSLEMLAGPCLGGLEQCESLTPDHSLMVCLNKL